MVALATLAKREEFLCSAQSQSARFAPEEGRNECSLSLAEDMMLAALAEES
jgi:hypothetical protein